MSTLGGELAKAWQMHAADQAGCVSLLRHVDRHGTPLFVYSGERVEARVATLREVLPAGLKLLYSVKANPLPALVARLASQADGFDVASAAEIEVALAAGMAGSRLSLAGPGKRDEDLAAALACGALVVLESAEEGRRLGALADGARARVALRINPPFELAGEFRMGGGARKFGVDSEAAEGALKALAGMPLDFVGLHVYPGSNCLDGRQLAATLLATFRLAVDLAPLAPGPIRELNLGGGFGVPCLAGERALDLEAVGEVLAVISEELARCLPGAEASLELGRFLVAEAGIYVARVLDRKVSRGRGHVVLDGGMNHHWHATAALEGRRERHFPMWVVGGQDRPLETVSVCGPLCAPQDTWAENIVLPQPRIGDLVVVFRSGAYGPSASPAAFMSRRAAAEVLA